MNNKTLKIILVLIGFFAFTHQAHSILNGLTGGVFYNHGVNSGPGVMTSVDLIKGFSVVATAGYALPVETTEIEYRDIVQRRELDNALNDAAFSLESFFRDGPKVTLQSYTMSLGLAYMPKYLKLGPTYLRPQVGLGAYAYKSTILLLAHLENQTWKERAEHDFFLMGWGGIDIKVMKNVTLSLMANVLKFSEKRIKVSLLNIPSDYFGSKEYRGSLSVGLNYTL